MSWVALHLNAHPTGVELLDSRDGTVFSAFARCWWNRVGYKCCNLLPGSHAPQDQKQWIGMVVEHTREDGMCTWTILGSLWGGRH